MKQIMQNYRNGMLTVEDVPVPIIQKGGVLVRNQFSAISAGTEKSILEVAKKSYIGKAKEKPAEVKKTLEAIKTLGFQKAFELVMNKLDTPIPLGYSSSGTIIEVGENATEFNVGDRVACAGAGYANHAEVIYVPKNLCVKIPEGVLFEEAAYATIGSIAVQGVRQADVRFGETVVVIGLGLIGLLTVQILKAAGCIVIGVDLNPTAIDNALKCGADYAINSTQGEIIGYVQEISNYKGVDSVIITASTKSNDPISLAGEICRKKGKITIVGNVKMDIPRNEYYAKELEIKLSCSYGPGRYDPSYEEHGVDYPIGYVRWTEKRNMESFLQLIKEKKVKISDITTHKFKIENACDAYDLISGKKEEKFTGVLIEYNTTYANDKIIQVNICERKKTEQVNIGLIGAGNFAKAIILPSLKSFNGANLEGIITAKGYSAVHIAKKFKINKCFADPKDFFSDQNIDTVIIATRHNLHAPLVIDALNAGKNVYVEKPLAVSENMLKEIIKTKKNTKGDVFVGFNRRFAKHMLICKTFFEPIKTPKFINYVINAGDINKDSWVQNSEEGGGRIIGEVCHFVDLCQFICGSNYMSVFAQNTGDDKMRDNLAVLIKFEDGSLASINYTSKGNSSYPKERVEIFAQEKIAVIDDFIKLEIITKKRSSKFKIHQDKGHVKQIHSWLESIIQGKEIPIPFAESVNATIVTFMIHESLNKGKVISFNEYSNNFKEI